MSNTTPGALPRDRALAALLVRLDAARRVVEADADLCAADIRLLWLLSPGVPRTLRDISERLGLEQSTVNRQVNAALRNGLVARRRAPGQAAAVVTPTQAGRDAFDAVVEQSLDHYAAGLAALGEEADEFLRLLGAFVEQYSAGVSERVGQFESPIDRADREAS